MTSTNLREALGVRPDPEFDLVLPPGWTRRGVGKDALDLMLGSLKKRLMEEHKPQLFAELRPMLEQSFETMRRNGAIAFFAPTDPEPDTLWLPASIVASVRRAEAGQTLDELARTLIRHHGATPLLGDKRTLRFEKEKTVRLGTDTVINHSLVYLTPIPGARRRRALELVAGFGRTPQQPPDAPGLERMRTLFDTCVSTLKWHEPRAT